MKTCDWCGAEIKSDVETFGARTTSGEIARVCASCCLEGNGETVNYNECFDDCLKCPQSRACELEAGY